MSSRLPHLERLRPLVEECRDAKSLHALLDESIGADPLFALDRESLPREALDLYAAVAIYGADLDSRILRRIVREGEVPHCLLRNNHLPKHLLEEAVSEMVESTTPD